MTTLNLNTEMNTNTKTKRGKVLATLLAGLLALATAVVFGLTTPATGETKAVTFDGVEINDGGTILVNGSQPMTYYKNKLISTKTNGKKVTSAQIEAELANWSMTDFGSDPILNSISGSAKLIDASTWYKVSEILQQTDRDYWLADKRTINGVTVQAYRTKNNTVPDGPNISGAASNGYVWMDGASQGSLRGYALTDALTLGGFTWPGRSWLLGAGVSGNKASKCVYADTNIYVESRVALYYDEKWPTHPDYKVRVRVEGQEVWNNPWCIDDPSRGYYKTTYKDLSRGFEFFINKNGESAYQEPARQTLKNTYQLKVLTSDNYYGYVMPEWNENVETGDVLMSADIKAEELTDSTGFKTANNGYIVNYFKSAGTGYRQHLYKRTTPTIYYDYGVPNYSETDTTSSGGTYYAATNAVRPMWDFSWSNIAFFRDAKSGEDLETDDQLGSVPDSTLDSDSTKKSVFKDDDVTISLDVNKTKKVANKDVAENFYTNKDENRDQTTAVSDGVVKVPWGSSTLNIKNITTTNATHISALAETSSGKRYGLIGKAGDSTVSIYLSTLMDTANVGDEITVSLYAENIGKAQTSDSISATPVTFKVQIVGGRPTSITYNYGTNGMGNLPASSDPTKTLAGTSYAFGDGSSCYTQDGDMFALWQVTYTPYGEGTAVTKRYSSGEQFIVPDTTDGKVLVTATYAKMGVSKQTTTTSTVCSVTWNINKPSGATNANSQFKLNNNQSIEWINTKAKVTIAGGSTFKVTDDIIPTATDGETSWRFKYWSTSKYDSGNAFANDSGRYITKHTTYYAIWEEVTYSIEWNLNKSAYSGGNFSLDMSNVKTTYYAKDNYDENGPKPQKLIKPTSTPQDATGTWQFVCWKDASGNKVNFDTATVTVSATYYATWEAAKAGDYWLSDAKAANPEANIIRNKSQIDEDINAIRGGDSSVRGVYEGYMNSDNVHLYTRWYGSDGSGANKWAEFRIIQIGEHDSDGSTMTFMATHALPTAQTTVNTEDKQTSWSWRDSYIRNTVFASGGYVQTGLKDIVNLAQTVSKASIREYGSGQKWASELVYTNDKFWLPSIQEVGYTTPQIPESTVYSKFSSCRENVIRPLIDTCIYSRSGTKPTGIWENFNSYISHFWTRTAYTGHDYDRTDRGPEYWTYSDKRKWSFASTSQMTSVTASSGIRKCATVVCFAV